MTMPSLRAFLISAVLGASLALSGCDSQLDIDPKQSIAAEDALSTPQNVQSALVGAYESASDYDLYGGQLMMLPDLLGDDGELFWGGTFEQPRDAFTKSILVGNSFVEDQWDDGYRTINIANSVLSALGVLEDEDERARTEGEAKLLRAAMHFELVRLFARAYNDGDPAQNLGVPVVLTPTFNVAEGDESVFVARNTVAEVYDQVIQDMTDAADLLPEANGDFFTTYTASAYLSRVYLMQGAHAEAAEAASRVIESGQYALAETFAEAFNNSDNIGEYVYGILISAQDNANHSVSLFYDAQEADPNGSGRGDIDIQAPHFALYEDGDARADFFYEDDDGLIRTSKWSASNEANIPIIRLAELYLTRAEANLRAGTTVGAAPVDDVNAVRERAGLDALGSVTVEDVLGERNIELSFEGHTLHDLKRTEQDVGDIPWDAARLVYPIPQSVLDTNPNLTQNPGYGS